MGSDLILDCRKLNKRYPGVHALKDFDFDVQRGEVHALVGENGAGKSTFLKILSGAVNPDSGEIEFDGNPLSHLTSQLTSYNTKRATHLGIAMVYQELALVPQLSVAENIFLGHSEVYGFAGRVSWGEMRERAEELMDEFGLEIDVRDKAGRIGVGSQQLVEILRAVSRDVKLLLLDEPTSALSGEEIDILFNTVLRRMRDRGVSVVYISHRLEEVFQISDRTTVMRDGEKIETMPTAEATTDKIVQRMVGREITKRYVKKKIDIGEVVFEAKNVSAAPKVVDCSISVKRGEIVGLSGLMGSGRTEFARAMVGLDPRQSGEISVKGQKVEVRLPGDALNAGFAYLAENRSDSLIYPLGVAPNITIGDLDQVLKGGRIDRQREAEVGEEYVDNLSISTAGVWQPVRNLSGGNQQKVAIARWIYSNVDIFILDEPTRGIDVGAKVEVYELMARLLEEGKAIILISSELPEIVKLSDRVFVMHKGKTVAEYEGEEITQENIMYSATGQEVANGSSARSR